MNLVRRLSLSLSFVLGLMGAAEARDIVPFPVGYRAGDIVIMTNARQLFFVLGGGQAIRYPVGVGRAGMAWHGRAYVGNFGFDMFAKEAKRPAELILVMPDGAARVVADNLDFPNGCVITPDERTLIVAETMGRQLSAFDIAPDGSLSNRRIWANTGEATPDGICLDAEGAVWIASPPTREFLRVREGGEIAQRIAVPNEAIACMLGGDDGRTLYLVTGRVCRAPRALAERPGRIEAVRVSVPAAGWP